jgi:phosphate uptake regulator
VPAPDSEAGLETVERSAFRQALRQAEDATLAELAVVREALGRAVEAAVAGEAKLAEQVVADARELGRRYGEVHDRLLALIARQAPVVGDLRLATALLHVNDRRCFSLAVEDGDGESRREAAFFVAMMARALERIGDNAVDIGQQAAFAVSGRLRHAVDAGADAR